MHLLPSLFTQQLSYIIESVKERQEKCRRNPPKAQFCTKASCIIQNGFNSWNVVGQKGFSLWAGGGRHAFYWQLFLQYNLGMQGETAYNLLLIGRSGAGKSATTKLLTGNPAIRVANSLKEVTTEVACYEGTAFELAGELLRFRVLDIPGLDRMGSRAAIRERVLERLEQHALALHAIVYISSLTERDTVDESKLFGFLEQLPWSAELKRQALVPLFTKYDNLVFDSQEEEVASTKREFREIFLRHRHEAAWSKRIYWANHTKSLEFKMKNCHDIREKHEGQVQRLVAVIRRNKHPLTAQDIRETIDHEHAFILRRLFACFQEERIPFKKEGKTHEVRLTVEVEPSSVEESVTAVSASSIAIAISKVCLKEVASPFSLALMGIPIAIALLKLASQSFSFHDKQPGQHSSGEAVMRSYEHICDEINREMEREWRLINEQLEFTVCGKYLKCRVDLAVPLKFFDLTEMALQLDHLSFERAQSPPGLLEFRTLLPKIEDDLVWRPQISICYHVKKFNEEEVMGSIEALRKSFCSTI